MDMQEAALTAVAAVPALPAMPTEGTQLQEQLQVAAPEKPELPKRKHRAKPLTPKQAVTKFWNRGIFIAFHDPRETRPDAAQCIDINAENKPKYIVRCRCNPTCKTSFDGWDAYAYNRHFSYKKHLKWENARHDLGWDEGEAYRDFVKFIELTLDDSDEEEEEPAKTRAVKRARRKLDENTIDAIVRVEAKMRDPSSSISLKKGFKPDERRRQEMHYLQLWKEARAELRGMRQELANETDEEVAEELRKDMAGLKKRKEELAKFLGIEEDAISDDADTSGEVGVVKQEIDETGEVKQEMSV
jgi:hypothetical protein